MTFVIKSSASVHLAVKFSLPFSVELGNLSKETFILAIATNLLGKCKGKLSFNTKTVKGQTKKVA